MKRFFTTLALALCAMACSADVHAADAFSDAWLGRCGSSGAAVGGRGDHLRADARSGHRLSTGSSLATDANDIAFSHSTAARDAYGNLTGHSMNITVGRGNGSYSTLNSRAHCNGRYVRAGGRTSAIGSTAVGQAVGNRSLIEATADRFPKPARSYFNPHVHRVVAQPIVVAQPVFPY